MKNFKYTLAASAILIISGVLLTGCNFPPITSDKEDNTMMEDEYNDNDSSMRDDSDEDDNNTMMEEGPTGDHDTGDAGMVEPTGDHDLGDAGVGEPTGDHDLGDAGVEQDNARARYVSYTTSEAAAVNGKRAYAVFFHANWCPTCVGMEKDIEQNLSSLPDGTLILKANYDRETELKKQYGISTQSTVVIINAAGEQVKTLTAPSAQQIADAIKSA